jgi:hypothetical protein
MLHSILDRLFPKSADNAFRGNRLALWLLGILALMKAGIGANSIFNGRVVATSADGIPLDTFTPGGAQAVVSLFAIWGLSQLVICVLCLLVLLRYRALVPLMLALLLLEHLFKRMILQFLPIATVGAPPGHAVNLVLLALIVGGLVLSVGNRREPKVRDRSPT